MSSIFSGGPQSNTQRPSWTNAGGSYLANGQFPPGITDLSQLQYQGGFLGDQGGQQMYPFNDIFAGMGNLPGQAVQGGADLRQLSAMGSQQGFGNAMQLGQGAMGPVSQQQGLLGQMPQWQQSANAFAGGIMPGISGGNAPGMQMGPVTSAALGQMANTGPNGDIYARTLDMLRPQVRAGYSDRGLGTSGQAIQGESDQARTLADSFAQNAMNQRIGLLGAAGSAEGAEGSTQVGLGNVGVARGNLGVNAMMAVPQAYNQFMQAPNYALQGMGMAGQQQFSPLQLAGLGGGVFGQGLQMPIDTASGMYNATRAPMFQYGNFLNGVPNIASSGQREGFLGLG